MYTLACMWGVPVLVCTHPRAHVFLTLVKTDSLGLRWGVSCLRDAQASPFPLCWSPPCGRLGLSHVTWSLTAQTCRVRTACVVSGLASPGSPCLCPRSSVTPVSAPRSISCPHAVSTHCIWQCPPHCRPAVQVLSEPACPWASFLLTELGLYASRFHQPGLCPSSRDVWAVLGGPPFQSPAGSPVCWVAGRLASESDGDSSSSCSVSHVPPTPSSLVLKGWGGRCSGRSGVAETRSRKVQWPVVQAGTPPTLASVIPTLLPVGPMGSLPPGQGQVPALIWPPGQDMSLGLPPAMPRTIPVMALCVSHLQALPSATCRPRPWRRPPTPPCATSSTCTAGPRGCTRRCGRARVSRASSRSGRWPPEPPGSAGRPWASSD